MSDNLISNAGSAAASSRPLFSAMLRGARRRCPSCGEGALFTGFLRVRDRCGACGEALHHHRADDLPAYLAILLTGKLVIGLLIWSERNAPLGPNGFWIWPCIAALVALAVLSPLKGAVVGLQWAQRMHGFEGAEDAGAGRSGAGSPP